MADIKITPLGGVREFGKNMYLVEVNDQIFILDAGLKYAEMDMLGVDFVIPDISYLIENKARVAGIFLTHGHADSIGALPYIVAELKVPVFASELTIELAKINVKNYDASRKFNDFHVVDENTEIDFGQAVVSFFTTTHTIPDSLGVVIAASSGTIVYTGDFRFDPAVAKGYRTNMRRLAEIGNNGVLALLSSSPNALSTVQSASEHEIYEKIYDYIDDAQGRVIIACNAGNLGRIQQVLDAAIKIGRRVAFTGEDMDQIIETARRLKKLKIVDPKAIIKPSEIKKYEDDEVVILETGRMGEPLKILGEMAHHRHKFVQIKDGDLVLSVTSPTVSFETTIARIENDVYKAGGVMKMLSSDLKISGHANARDLQFMLDILRPKNLIPIQGEYRELHAHAELAMDMGMLPEHIFIGKRGETVEFDGDEMVPSGVIMAENVMIDGSGVGDIGSVVLRDRKVLSEDGIFIAVITISKHDKKIVSKSRVHTRGFVYVKTSRDLMREAGELVNETVDKYLAGKTFEWAELKGNIRDALGKFLYDQTHRKPVILPVVMEARNPQELNKYHGKNKKD
ncbi:RNase J family beta-CASP ribonuclease [Lactococcus hircilactis]|uniref:Ribonuclease J n=1 Tax=Lactococcus hircilactis TaxID=1494462 RepID=A0A7X1Z951_9LACT|nr:ribonuclease J [Lactococcus hircilactis]MQW40038.1 RNase J family beta-CASP ribonuclease [Lactococcus hircilactis]